MLLRLDNAVTLRPEQKVKFNFQMKFMENVQKKIDKVIAELKKDIFAKIQWKQFIKTIVNRTVSSASTKLN